MTYGASAVALGMLTWVGRILHRVAGIITAIQLKTQLCCENFTVRVLFTSRVHSLRFYFSTAYLFASIFEDIRKGGRSGRNLEGVWCFCNLQELSVTWSYGHRTIHTLFVVDFGHLCNSSRLMLVLSGVRLGCPQSLVLAFHRAQSKMDKLLRRAAGNPRVLGPSL